ncbi:uncharacterized protein LOC144445026 [Glandiceps talaboti]
MAAPIVTTRELKNTETGIDISIPTYEEIRGLLASTTEYHVIVISKLHYFKTPKHKDNDVVQFMIPKKYSDFEILHKTLDEQYPATVLPDLPKKTLMIKDSTVQQRRQTFEKLMKFIAANKKICASPTVLEFLGVNPAKSGKFRKVTKSTEEIEKDRKSESTGEDSKDEEKLKLKKTKSDLFGDDEVDNDADLFGDTKTSETDDIFTSVDKVTSEKESSAVLFEEQDLEMGPSMKEEGLFVPQYIEEEEKERRFEDEENTEDLLKIEDDIDKLLQIDPNKPKTKPKPSAKPTPPPKPSPKKDKKVSAEEDPFTMATGDASDLGQDDILKYIQDNTQEEEATLDLF